MISARTKRQLVIFVIITLVGVAYVGGRYARLDRLVHDPTYKVAVHLKESGGIFTGAEVAYRGVRVGNVSDMVPTSTGVDVILAIDNSWDRIPASTLAVVANKSAVGEQYVNLEPKTGSAPYLKGGDQIQTNDTRIPTSTVEILSNLDALVRSVPQDSLKTSVHELGQAFVGTGTSLSELVDSTSAFIRTANDNFASTAALIKDSRQVLQTQIDQTSSINTFANNLALFTDVLAGHDASLRKLVASGSATAYELQTFLKENDVDLSRLISNLLVTGKVGYAHIKGTQQILALYPDTVAGGFTVLQKTADGNYNARFGLILQQQPGVCTKGYDLNGLPRQPSDLSPAQLPTNNHCTATDTNARGSQHSPRNRPPVAAYDNGKITWFTGGNTPPANVGDSSSGKDEWSWLLLQPAMPTN